LTDKKRQNVGVITLGCSKNTVDSEYLLHHLRNKGFTVHYDNPQTTAEIVIINTCGFIADAKEESVNTILYYAEQKKQGNINKLIIMGCLSQRYRTELKQEIPEADHIYGVYEMDKLLTDLIPAASFQHSYKRYLTTPNHYAYLKIAEGCSRRCAFCAIPLIKGDYHSRTPDTLYNEAENLIDQGVKELILIAQDISYYGKDLSSKPKLKYLLNKLLNLGSLEWIRLLYAYPESFPDDILPLINDNPRICKYLDIPVQHISDHMLKIMRRGASEKSTRNLIHRIKLEVPGIALRTSVLVGHPGETEADFENLLHFVEETRFERLGVFTYSHEEGTYAYKHYQNDVAEEIKQERAARIMEIQQEISLKHNQNKIGENFTTLIDREEGDYWIGRTELDAPEVDNEVLIPKDSSFELQVGTFYDITITHAEDFDLFGTTQ